MPPDLVAGSERGIDTGADPTPMGKARLLALHMVPGDHVAVEIVIAAHAIHIRRVEQANGQIQRPTDRRD